MRHVPYFCEENVWQLARDPDVVVGGERLVELERVAVFVTNRERTVATWAQRAGDPVVWDYHVMLLARGAGADRNGWRALDLDTTLGFDIPAAAWLEGSFLPIAPVAFAPRFRVVPLDELDATFASDRSHMRDAQGAWLKPPPPWPPITSAAGSMTLPRYLDLDDPIAGAWCDLAAMRRRFAAGG